VEETETAVTCLGCAFIHKFMLEVLPPAIKNEQSEKNKDKIDTINYFPEHEDSDDGNPIRIGGLQN
jgi:hypothetical protein